MAMILNKQFYENIIIIGSITSVNIANPLRIMSDGCHPRISRFRWHSVK